MSVKMLCRKGKSVSGLFLLIYALTIIQIFGQSQVDAQTLASNQQFKREMTGAETHRYQFELKANEFFQVRVEQKGVDVALKLLDEEKKTLATMNSPNGKAGFETLSFVAETSGRFVLEVIGYGGMTEKGIYIVKREVSRNIVDTDRQRLETERLFVEGLTARDLKQNETAVNILEEVLVGWREIKDEYLAQITSLQISRINTIITKALIDKSLQNQDEKNRLAVETYYEAMSIRQSSPESEEAIKKSIEKFQVSVELFKQARRWSSVGTIYLELGRSFDWLGKFAESIENHQKSRYFYRLDNDVRGEIIAINGMGWIHRKIGNSRKGLSNHLLARTLFQKFKLQDKPLEVTIIHSIATSQIEVGLYNEAIPYLEKALQLRKETNDTYGEGAVYFDFGTIYKKLDQSEKALIYFNKCYSIHRQFISNFAQANVLNQIASIYVDLDKKDESFIYYSLALQFVKGVAETILVAQIYRNIMEYWIKYDQPVIAIIYGKKAVKIYQELRLNLKKLDRNSQKIFLTNVVGTYRRLADLLISQGRFAEAQAVLDLLKEDEYGQLTRSGETSDTVPYSKAEEDAIKVIENLATLGRRRTELEKLQTERGNLSAVEQKELDEIYAGIEKANKELQKALEALKNAEPTAKEKLAEIESQQNLTATLEDLSRETGAGAVALYTVVGTEEIKDASGKADTKSKFGWVVLVTPKESKAYPIDVAELEETVFAFRGGLSSTVYNPEPLAKKLYDKIFRQKSPRFNSTLEQDLQKLFGGNDKIPTIMWSLDGVLRYVPMAALHDGKSYLVEKYRHLVFTKQSLAGLSVSDKKWSVLGLGISEKREGFEAIPGVEKELKDIVCQSAETNCIIGGTRLLNNEFKKEETFRLWQSGKFPVIHIASHFSFNPTDQTASFLLIGDGRLNFSDIQNKRGLFNAVDLLTLSACDTAMSANGKESESFAWLAQSLGAKTVLASLWKVSDAGTPELMIRFYKIRSENPQMPKAEAFRRAQISLLGAETKSQTSGKPRSGVFEVNGKKYELPLWEKDKHPQFAHPHFWSSFVLIGNWR